MTGATLSACAAAARTAACSKTSSCRHITIRMNHAATLFGHTPGSRLHDGESLYGRLFNAFPEGSLAAVAVGMAKAAINEYAHIVKIRNAGPSGRLRVGMGDYQRTPGLAIVITDTAHAATSGAPKFTWKGRRLGCRHHALHQRGRPVLDGMHHTVEKMVAEVVEPLADTAPRSSTSGRPFLVGSVAAARAVLKVNRQQRSQSHRSAAAILGVTKWRCP